MQLRLLKGWRALIWKPSGENEQTEIVLRLVFKIVDARPMQSENLKSLLGEFMN